MKAVPYIRLSNTDQSSYSIDNQLRGIKEYCDKYNLQMESPFIDNGESSYTFDRADFNKLETFVKKNRPEYIVVYHLDRFSRNLAEALLKIKEYLGKYKVRVRDISEPLDLDDNDPNTFLMRSFRFMMAESELHRITKRIQDGMRQGALSGRHLNMAPYGYKNARDSNNKPILVIDQEKSLHIQMIFRQYIAGHTIETVRQLAKKLGYSGKGNSAMQRVLTNQTYIGMVRLPKSEGWVKGLHTPIISEFDFWQAQNLLNKRNKKAHHPQETAFLKGVLKDQTGELMTAGNSKGRSGAYYWYYVSKVSRQHFAANKLHGQFYELLENLNISKEKALWLKEKVKTAIEQKIKTQSETIKKLSAVLEETRARIATAEEKYLMESDISQASYQKSVAALRQKESGLLNELMNVEQPASHLLNKMNDLLPLLQDVKAIFLKMPVERQQHFVRAVFDNSLAYYNDCYRTPFIHPLFASKLNELKEKRLLIVEQPFVKMGENPIVHGTGILSNPETILDNLHNILFLLTA